MVAILLRLAARGALVGAAAAFLVALGDFGATWLWLPWWPDRGWLLVRLVTTLVPVGATLGAALFALGGALEGPLRRLAGRAAARDDHRNDHDHRARRYHALWPIPFVALASPALIAVAIKLFEGGSASRLPALPLWITAAALVLLAGTYAALRLGRAVYERLRTVHRPAGLAAAGALFLLHVALAKIDQNVYPKLYEYLHALLSAAAFLIAALAIAVAAHHLPRVARAIDRHPAIGLGVLAALWLVLAVDLATLDHNQNVRVAMFDPRAATSRSLMQGLDPVLRDLSGGSDGSAAAARARRARTRRNAAGLEGLPVWPEAHVLFVTVDALRADHLGAYGYDRPISENMDRLASEGVVFEQAYAQAPHSSYSLCSFMTSEYLHETVDIGRPLPETTLPDALEQGGMHTAALYTNGIFHTEGERLEVYHDRAFGFELHDHSDHRAEPKTDAALAEIDRIVEQGEPPSFLWVHYFDVHEPYRERSLGDSAVDRYDGEIRNVDRALGRLLKQARARLDRELIVILSADHGEEFRDHGGLYHGSSLYEEQVRVPLVVHAPGLEPRRVQAPVEAVDVAPTVLGMLGLPTPASMRGDDLRPLMTGRLDDLGPAFAGVMRKRMVVRWPYKLVADLRFGLFELYNLSKDPAERQNLADRKPEVVEELRGELYAWLDSLRHPPGQDANRDPRQQALDRGHLGDRRALEPLAELVRDETAPTEMRCEAARLLGDLSDDSVAGALARAMSSPDRLVAAEAAIALGRLYDQRARPALRDLIYSEDTDLRTRAAISLARLRDDAAVPALIHAATAARTKNDRKEAIRWLGRLGDRRAVGPLLELLPELRVRSQVVVALGLIGDPQTHSTLLEVLDWEHRPTIRDYVARALGQMGNPEATDRLVDMAATEPGLGYVGESLVRVGAIERGAAGGTDVGPQTAAARGLGRCRRRPRRDGWSYSQRTWCATKGASAALRLRVPEAVHRANGAIALLRARRLDAEAPVEVKVTVGGQNAATLSVDDEWTEHRFELEAERVAPDRLTASIEAADPDARLGLDHFLLIPRPPHLASR